MKAITVASIVTDEFTEAFLGVAHSAMNPAPGRVIPRARAHTARRMCGMTVIAHTSDKTMKVTAIYGSTARGTSKERDGECGGNDRYRDRREQGYGADYTFAFACKAAYGSRAHAHGGDYARGYAASGADYDGEGIFVRFRDERSACDVAGEQPVEVGDESFAESQPYQTADDGVKRGFGEKYPRRLRRGCARRLEFDQFRNPASHYDGKR